MVAGDGDDNDQHEDQQPAGHRTHNDHQQVLHDLGLALSLCTVESLDISTFSPSCLTLDYLCGMLTALSSTCYNNLHMGASLPHVIPRQALVGASIRHAEGSSKIQRPVWVGDYSFRQFTTVSKSRRKEQSLQVQVVLLSLFFWFSVVVLMNNNKSF